MRRLDDDTAFITGGSSGIGAAIALEVARLGARVYLGARRADRLEQARTDIERAVPEARGRVSVGVLDVRDDASVERWLAAAPAPCSILVNNAGLVVGRERVEEAKLEDWDTIMDTNVRSLMRMTRKVVPGLIERGRGDVVMMASVAGSEPYANGAAYCASKAAVQAFARSLRAELLGKDIRVLTFDPGLVETEFSIVRMRGDIDAAKKVYAGMTPLTAADIAECVAFALSRPRHVSLDRMLILAADQLGTQQVHRRPS